MSRHLAAVPDVDPARAELGQRLAAAALAVIEYSLGAHDDPLKADEALWTIDQLRDAIDTAYKTATEQAWRPDPTAHDPATCATCQGR